MGDSLSGNISDTHQDTLSRINMISLFLSVYYFSVSISNFLSVSLSGLADERPGKGVCGQRLWDVQHAAGAAEIISQAWWEEGEFKRKKRGMETKII